MVITTTVTVYVSWEGETYDGFDPVLKLVRMRVLTMRFFIL